MASYDDFTVATQDNPNTNSFFFASSNYSGIASLLISERKETPNHTPDSKNVQDQEQGGTAKSSTISDESDDSSVARNEYTITASPKTKKPSFFESFHVLKDPQFMSLTLAELTASIGYLIPYYYMQSKFPIKERRVWAVRLFYSLIHMLMGSNPGLMSDLKRSNRENGCPGGPPWTCVCIAGHSILSIVFPSFFLFYDFSLRCLYWTHTRGRRLNPGSDQRRRLCGADRLGLAGRPILEQCHYADQHLVYRHLSRGLLVYRKILCHAHYHGRDLWILCW